MLIITTKYRNLFNDQKLDVNIRNNIFMAAPNDYFHY